MAGHLTFGSQVARLSLRCECGATISADSREWLVELTRLHFEEFHPDLGASFPPDLILAMAEQGEADLE